MNDAWKPAIFVLIVTLFVTAVSLGIALHMETSEKEHLIDSLNDIDRKTKELTSICFENVGNGKSMRWCYTDLRPLLGAMNPTMAACKFNPGDNELTCEVVYVNTTPPMMEDSENPASFTEMVAENAVIWWEEP